MFHHVLVQQQRVPLSLIGEGMIVAHDSDESLARYGLVEDPALVGWAKQYLGDALRHNSFAVSARSSNRERVRTSGCTTSGCSRRR